MWDIFSTFCLTSVNFCLFIQFLINHWPNWNQACRNVTRVFLNILHGSRLFSEIQHGCYGQLCSLIGLNFINLFLTAIMYHAVPWVALYKVYSVDSLWNFLQIWLSFYGFQGESFKILFVCNSLDNFLSEAFQQICCCCFRLIDNNIQLYIYIFFFTF